MNVYIQFVHPLIFYLHLSLLVVTAANIVRVFCRETRRMSAKQ